MAELNIEDEITRAKRGMMWVKLEESLDGAGCPVCNQVGRSEAHYLESMLYEYVLDAGVRKKLHHSHGFCTRHAATALEAEKKLNSDGLHLATMYDSVLDEGLRILKNQITALEELEKEKRRRRPEKQVHPAHASKCFVCEFAAEAEAGAVHGLLYFSRDRDFLKMYAASKAIICFRHIEALVKERVGLELVSETVQKVEKLKVNLSEFIRKHDHQSAHDYREDELNSYVSAVRFFAGSCR